MGAGKSYDVCRISIHALLAESDRLGAVQHAKVDISIHALLAESDHLLTISSRPTRVFLSTLSLRRATKPCRVFLCLKNISIHALLAESDSIGTLRTVSVRISIHALLAESDGLGFRHYRDDVSFLSTLSLRRATPS